VVEQNNITANRIVSHELGVVWHLDVPQPITGGIDSPLMVPFLPLEVTFAMGIVFPRVSNRQVRVGLDGIVPSLINADTEFSPVWNLVTDIHGGDGAGAVVGHDEVPSPAVSDEVGTGNKRHDIGDWQS